MFIKLTYIWFLFYQELIKTIQSLADENQSSGLYSSIISMTNKIESAFIRLASLGAKPGVKLKPNPWFKASYVRKSFKTFIGADRVVHPCFHAINFVQNQTHAPIHYCSHPAQYVILIIKGGKWGEIIVYSRSTINACSLLSHKWWVLLIKFMVGSIIHVRGGSTHLWYSGST